MTTNKKEIREEFRKSLTEYAHITEYEGKWQINTIMQAFDTALNEIASEVEILINGLIGHTAYRGMKAVKTKFVAKDDVVALIKEVISPKNI